MSLTDDILMHYGSEEYLEISIRIIPISPYHRFVSIYDGYGLKVGV